MDLRNAQRQRRPYSSGFDHDGLYRAVLYPCFGYGIYSIGNGMMDNRKEFTGMVIKLWENGKTYAEIAKELGVVERTLYKWLSGERKISKTVMKLMTVLTAKQR